MGTDVHELSSSTGGDSEGWPDAPYNNPGFIFGQLLFHEWTSKAEQVEAIAEFAKIKELGWAREILRGIATDVGAFYHDDDNTVWSEMRCITDVENFRNEILFQLEQHAEKENEE